MLSFPSFINHVFVNYLGHGSGRRKTSSIDDDDWVSSWMKLFIDVRKSSLDIQLLGKYGEWDDVTDVVKTLPGTEKTRSTSSDTEREIHWCRQPPFYMQILTTNITSALTCPKFFHLQTFFLLSDGLIVDRDPEMNKMNLNDSQYL